MDYTTDVAELSDMDAGRVKSLLEASRQIPEYRSHVPIPITNVSSV